jgi:hypothetical protein
MPQQRPDSSGLFWSGVAGGAILLLLAVLDGPGRFGANDLFLLTGPVPW